MKRESIKRKADYQIISDWIEPKSKVLDLGCGRGLLLSLLSIEKGIYGVGVDNDEGKVLSCISRGINVYQGDILTLLGQYPDQYFDWVICSQTVHELPRPFSFIVESLRVGKQLAVGFINYGFWRNRLNIFINGHLIKNAVYPDPWHKRMPSNPASINDFESFCKKENIHINRKISLDGTWMKHCRWFPSLFAGYIIYNLSYR